MCSQYCNKVQIVALNNEKQEFEKKLEFDHPYPATKIMWLPDKAVRRLDLLGTSGDYMRIWEVKDNSVHLVHTLTNVALCGVLVCVHSMSFSLVFRLTVVLHRIDRTNGQTIALR